MQIKEVIIMTAS